MEASRVAVSVVLCTYNPRRDILADVLDALERQTLPKDQWEFVVVDNNSTPPLTAEEMTVGRTFAVRIVRETEQGKVPAYRCAMQSAQAELIVLIDDDNILDADYLESALRIARQDPTIGVFGGICRAKFEAGEPPRWKRSLLPFLGIVDRGERTITSIEDRWGEWEPIGAGMCIRRACGLKFLEMLDQYPEGLTLDRSKGGLLSGGDSFLARSAYRSGFACSYQPSLKLTHVMKAPRLKCGYLARIMYGHGKSVILLAEALRQPWKPIGLFEVFARFPFRMMTQGLGGPLWWMWDFGYYAESRSRCRARARNAAR